MSHAKGGSKRKHRSKTLPVLGATGLSLTLAGGASATNGRAADMPPAPNTAANHEIILGEEEISDVSLGTFYVFDKENPEAFQPNIQLARGGCGCGHGCGGGRGCGGVRGCGGFRGCGWGGCGGCWGWGMGLGGCCLSWGGCAAC